MEANYFTILYWFCHTSTWICHRCTCVPHPEPSSLLPPHPIPLGRPSALAPSIQYRASNLDWQLVSYMIFHSIIFQDIMTSHCFLPNSILDWGEENELFILFLLFRWLRHPGLQHSRPPCPSISPRVYPNSCPLSHDASHPSPPLTSSSPFAFNLSQHQSLFQWVVCSHQAKILELQLQHQTFQWIFRIDFL